MDALIPPPRSDDDEDVHWALSTASALWARGERSEALKWLRRAAEQASDANADERALVLFKAAADISTRLTSDAQQGISSTPAPATPARATAPSAKPASVFPPAPKPASAFPPAPKPASVVPPPPVRGAPTPAAARSPNAPAPSAPAAQGAAPAATRGAVPSAPVRAGAARTTPSARVEDFLPPEQRRGSTAEPAAPAPGASSSSGSSRVPVASKPIEARPHAPRRRNSETGRRRVVDGELREVNPSARTSSLEAARARTAPKTDRRGADDEPTGQQAASPLRDLVTRPKDVVTRYDDLDEETSVLEARRKKERSSDADPQPKAGAASEASAGADTEDDDDLSPWGGEATTVMVSPLLAESAATSAAVPSTQRAIQTLGAMRIAVLPGRTPGEARAIALSGTATPPAGAVQAILVPLTADDGGALLRLLGGG